MIVDLPNHGLALAEIRREAHRTTPKRPPPCRTSRRSTAAAPCTPSNGNTVPNLGPPRSLNRVGASPFLPLDSPEIRTYFAVGGDMEPSSHSINLTFVLPPPESQQHRMRGHKASRDTAHPCSALVTFARSDWDIDPNLNLLCAVGLGHRPEPVLTLPDRVGILTRASTRTPPGRIGSSTRASTNSTWSDWDIYTSHHIPTVGFGNGRLLNLLESVCRAF
jgi:hypothetical protein